MDISTFKQMSVEKELEIPGLKPNIESINEVFGTVKVKGCHLIETPTYISQEGQKLTGYKIVVSAELSVVIKYTALELTQGVHSAHYIVPFSAFLVMPDGYRTGSKLDVSGQVEHVYFKVHDERTFFTNITLMLNAKILSC